MNKNRMSSLFLSLGLAGACCISLAPVFAAGVKLPAAPAITAQGYGPIAALSGGQTTVSWQPVSKATAYNLYWDTEPGVTKKAKRVSVTESPYVHANLPYGQKYYYRLAAVVGGKETALGAEVSAIARVYTTVQRQIVPVPVTSTEAVRPFDIPLFEKYGYGRWVYQPGLPFEKRLELMPRGYAAASGAQTDLLRFFTFTDLHVTDKESPAEAVYFGLSKKGIISAYSPAMLYTTHVLDAAVRTVNALHKESPFDFGLMLGDAANSTQYNELRWFIDIMDGREIKPASGRQAGADRWDYQKPYKAAGLDPNIPWYTTLGNHDHFWVGSFPVSDKTRQAAIGSEVLNIGNIFTNALGTASTGYYMGYVDGNTEFGTPKGAGPEAMFPVAPITTPDPDRRELARTEWLAEHLNTVSLPKGHGITAENAAKGFACYTFQPNPNLPLKVIVLDNTQSDTDPSDGSFGPDWGHGSLDKERYDWLVNELEIGQRDGQLMIIAAHIPIGVTKPGALEGWSKLAAVTEPDFIAKLNTYPNLVLWVAGHRHLNTITPLPSNDPARPELGFWEVETSSLREFPQEFRTIRFALNEDNTLSIFVANVDPIVDGSLAAKARTYAIAANQIFGNPGAQPENAELLKMLTPEMQAKLKKAVTPAAQ